MHLLFCTCSSIHHALSELQLMYSTYMYCTYIQHIPLQLGLAVGTTIVYAVHLHVNKFTYIHKNNTLMFLSFTNVL